MEIWVADRVTKMQLKILGVTRSDLTTYRCGARNILGQQEGRISLTGGKYQTWRPGGLHVSFLLQSPSTERRGGDGWSPRGRSDPVLEVGRPS